MRDFDYSAASEDDTARLGAALAETLPDGTTVALLGALGAGKTHLVRTIAAAAGTPADQVVSPTFVLCQQYRGSRVIYHADAYRIGDDDEFLQLGPDEWFESDAITFIEWADRVAACLPHQRIQIEIEATGDTSRRFRITAIGERLHGAIDALQARLQAAH